MLHVRDCLKVYDNALANKINLKIYAESSGSLRVLRW